MEPSDVLIRPPEERDARRLAEVHIAAWRAAYRDVMSEEYLAGLDVERRTEGWRRGIAIPQPHTYCLVIEVGSRVEGFVIAGPPQEEAEPGTGQLYAINLHPDAWSRGLGSQLFSAAEDLLQNLGYQRAFLWVAQGNERAIRFYTARNWLDDGGRLEDAFFSPPVLEKRHSRRFS